MIIKSFNLIDINFIKIEYCLFYQYYGSYDKYYWRANERKSFYTEAPLSCDGTTLIVLVSIISYCWLSVLSESYRRDKLEF